MSRRAIAPGFAGMPDRGDLVAYPRHSAAVSEGAYTWHRADISEAHAISAIAGGRLSLTAPSGEKLDFRFERHIEHTSGDWTWVGRSENGAASDQAIITFGEHAVFGRIAQPGKAPLRLTIRDGKAWLVETDPAKIALIDNHITRPTEPDYRIPTAAAGVSSAATGLLPVGAAAAQSANAATIVDAVIGYTNGFANELGGSSQAVTRINFLIEVANTAYLNSQINARLRLVGTVQVNYRDDTSNGSTLDKLTGTNSVAIDPAFNALRAARDQYGADVVSLVRKFDQQTNGGCGIAWLIGGGQQSYTTRNEGSAYSVVSDGRDPGPGGTTYFCTDDTLAHEIGHNMGAQHDRATASSSGTLAYGAFAYSFGYKQGGANGFHTIMAYGDEGQDGYSVFSNPRITFCGGQACGIADNADNARTLTATIPIMATFRAAKLYVRNDFDGDGRSDVYWRNAATGYNDLWFMSGAALSRSATVHREPDQSWTVVGSGDFDGDGRLDVLWRNVVTGQVFIHLMNGDRVIGGGLSITVADLNWKIVALGDFDGDRRTDLYWRNMVNGTNDVWLMNGVMPRDVATVHREPDMNWTVVGAGDFNGDGYADIFWRNTVTGQNFMHLMSGFNKLPGSGGVQGVDDQNFRVAAIADFNGDGRSDLYWRHRVTGQCYLWTMSAAAPTSVDLVHTEADQNWQIVNSGDYNGDGKADIFWRNQRNGQNVIHLMNGKDLQPGSGMTTTVSDLNWKVTGT
ncbi:reprolysin-like metallopeptidase [Pseudomonas sp. CGJS7]|uniref:reprolysin-like metallopeptidase n=1 Tax=Pseudomonas sp. CGJS7 TaxID=3109348 RepID=UPI003009E520